MSRNSAPIGSAQPVPACLTFPPVSPASQPGGRNRRSGPAGVHRKRDPTRPGAAREASRREFTHDVHTITNGAVVRSHGASRQRQPSTRKRVERPSPASHAARRFMPTGCAARGQGRRAIGERDRDVRKVPRGGTVLPRLRDLAERRVTQGIRERQRSLPRVNGSDARWLTVPWPQSARNQRGVKRRQCGTSFAVVRITWVAFAGLNRAGSAGEGPGGGT